MKWMSVVLVAALLVQVSYLPCSAQEEGPDALTVAPGTRVRITRGRFASYDQLIGTFEIIETDTLMMFSEQGTSLAISLASVTKLEVNQGTKRSIGKGAKIGLLAGASAGLLWGLVGGDNDDPVFYGAVGLAVGALAGAAFMRTSRWQEVPLDRIHLGLLPQRHGGLALSFNF